MKNSHYLIAALALIGNMSHLLIEDVPPQEEEKTWEDEWRILVARAKRANKEYKKRKQNLSAPSSNSQDS